MTRTALPVVILVAIAAPPVATAGPLPTWTYQHIANVAIRDLSAGSGLSIPNSVPSPMTGSGTASVEVVQWSIAGAGSPDTVSAQPYTFSLTLTDQASGASGLATFSGALSGSYWKAGADLTNQFTGDTVQTLTLGDYAYTVSLTDFTPPTVAGVEGGGRITARVEVSELTPGEGPIDPGPTDPAATPEPTTLLIATAGLVVAGGRRLVRRTRG
ncbi:MAG: hypothetical protein ABGY75_09165 [Gemmataceae bacterium]